MTTITKENRPQTSVRIVQRPGVGNLPSVRYKLTNTPCQKCGNKPTNLSGRCAAELERSCSNCGHIEFL